ncbi:hypothetical protein VBD025_09175 [Virgibacillus flavescens]|uniref:hypothetical protein n=1 Tax=Virgibacillus flavescens TaxID=1611422 RepID=UPI003D32F097
MWNVIRNITVLFILVTVLLAGCGLQSEKEVIKETEDAAKQAFLSEEKIELNKTIDDLSFYLPDDLTVKEANKTNVILKKDDQTYIVFYNNLEDSSSKLNYKSASQQEEALLMESFTEQGKFGYIRVDASKEEKYELQIGIGGVKITTYTEKASMVEDSKNLMKIARSIVESNKEIK